MNQLFGKRRVSHVDRPPKSVVAPGKRRAEGWIDLHFVTNINTALLLLRLDVVQWIVDVLGDGHCDDHIYLSDVVDLPVCVARRMARMPFYASQWPRWVAKKHLDAPIIAWLEAHPPVVQHGV